MSHTYHVRSQLLFDLEVFVHSQHQTGTSFKQVVQNASLRQIIDVGYTTELALRNSQTVR